jgi:hypothetical protein
MEALLADEGRVPLLGHESAATTLNQYAGLFPTDLDDVADRLDATLDRRLRTKGVSRHYESTPTTDPREAKRNRAVVGNPREP